MEKRKPSYTAGGNVNWCSWEQTEVLGKQKEIFFPSFIEL